jgi:FtsP/CotA-like multicopper oxidase with cupredoxin domain
MRATKMNKTSSIARLLLAPIVALLLTAAAHATAPGITGTGAAAGTFNLTAQAAFISQPDGQAVYSWGYGCVAGSAPSFLPSTLTLAAFCSQMQVPGPTLIVTEGESVTINLTNNLPLSAGSTSILFPGFTLTSATGGVAGLLTQEAAPGTTVQYVFTASSPGTHAYYSGTQGDLQVEMGLYGAIIVLPAAVPSACNTGLAAQNLLAEAHWNESDFRLANATGGVGAAYDNPKTCYDREYLFQFSEMDPTIHKKAEQQVAVAAAACTSGGAGSMGCSLEVPTEPYHPSYFLINGRSMPDDMDPNYAPEYAHQPYNGDPHMHPGEQVLLRVIGQGRWQHPFHEHGNHVRILGRDGNLILAPDNANLAGPLLFTTTTTPGVAFDGIFYWTGRGLNWDAYAHNPASSDPNAKLPCVPDPNGYNTGDPTAINYFEWCQDHNKPLEVAPFGDVAAGGPATLPDPNLFTNGPWFSGSPYLGPNATTRATFGACDTGYPTAANSQCSTTGTTPPSGTIANSPSSEAGYAFMWHSHNEREITTNNVFPGGMLMMMLVDSREFVIDETN